MRNKLLMLVALFLGGFIFYTSAAGPFESLVHRSLFLALVIGLGLLTYPLGAGKTWRPVGVVIDCLLALGAITACLFITFNANSILTTLPWATPRIWRSRPF
ncbi:hypothetical protein HAALTHF_16160n [Vreelandella aquamarina]|nr:hypothetical protein HAALTHF_16160n [Halomonas axialensis]